MKMREDIRPVTYLKSRAADLLTQLNQTHRPVIITQNNEPRAVIQDPVTFERTKTAIGLMKLLVQGEDDLRSKRAYEGDKFFRRLGKMHKSLKVSRAKKAKK